MNEERLKLGDMNDVGVERLIEAIVEQAAADWRFCAHGHDHDDAERFFFFVGLVHAADGPGRAGHRAVA